MELVVRAAAVYLVLLVVFRIAGKRSLAQITTFDFVWLLVMSEAVQQALIGQDFSVTGAALLLATLVTIDLLLSWLKDRFPRLDRLIDSVPLVIVDHGRVLHERMRKERVSVEDVLAAARMHLGLERLDQIKYAVVERSGGISILPKKQD
jgi:uncharacterized membrane protein YcaP (DUF421 family)